MDRIIQRIALTANVTTTTLIAPVVIFLTPACSSKFAFHPHSDIDFDPDTRIPSFRFTSQDAARIDALTESIQNHSDVPSFAVGVVHQNQLVYAKAHGFRSLSATQPATTKTLYHIGSVSKPITATILAILVEHGRIALDDPIQKYLPPNVKAPTYQNSVAEITVRHLVTHSSGLPRDPPNRRNVPHGIRLNPGQAEPYSVDELYQALPKTRLRFEPGTTCEYSNYGFGLLGHILERVANQPFEALMKQSLFKPLGMNHSTVTLDKSTLHRLATHYWHDDQGRPRIDRPPTRFGDIFGHGGVVSSVDDLARFVSLQFKSNPSLIRLETLHNMRTPQTTTTGSGLLLERDGLPMNMALGWRVQSPEANGGIVNHSGEMDGHSAYLAFAPNAELGIIVLANLGGTRFRQANPTVAMQLGVQLKEQFLYPAVGWTIRDIAECPPQTKYARKPPRRRTHGAADGRGANIVTNR
ncbi:MAG: serine hydrolase domain-containing protein [Verrucomicrobiota bacterium]